MSGFFDSFSLFNANTMLAVIGIFLFLLIISVLVIASFASPANDKEKTKATRNSFYDSSYRTQTKAPESKSTRLSFLNPFRESTVAKYTLPELPVLEEIKIEGLNSPIERKAYSSEPQ